MLQQSRNHIPDKYLYVDGSNKGTISFNMSIPDSNTCLLLGAYKFYNDAYGSSTISYLNTANFIKADKRFQPVTDGYKAEFEVTAIPGKVAKLTGIICSAYLPNCDAGTTSLTGDNYANGIIKCDNRLCNGHIERVVRNDDNTVSIFIGKNIKNLRDAITLYDFTHYDSDKDYIVACAEIRTDYCTTYVKSYNKSTGELIISGSAITDSEISALNNNSTYEIYTSYIIDEQRLYVVRNQAALSSNSYYKYERGELIMKTVLENASATYKRHIVYDGTDSIIFDSGRIYTGNEYSAYQSSNDIEIDVPNAEVSRLIKIEVGTTDGDVLNFEQTVEPLTAAGELTVTDFNNDYSGILSFKLTIDCEMCLSIYRKERNGKCKCVAMGSRQALSEIGTYQIIVYDYAAPLNKEYCYYIEGVDIVTGNLFNWQSEYVKRPCTGACICSLESGWLNQKYFIKDVYTFKDAETNTDVKYNLGINSYTTTKQPIVTRSDTDYRSGTFSTSFIDVDFANFEKDILTQNIPLLLLLPSGDRFIVKICGEPQKTYDPDTKITSMTFDWAEVDKFENRPIKVGTYIKVVSS